MSCLDDVYFNLDLPQTRPFQVIGFGENTVDLVCRVPDYPQQGSKLQMSERLRLGGGTIATACALYGRYGLKTRYVGRVGDDELGQFAVKRLAEEPMDVAVEVVPGAGSHFSLIVVDQATGSRTILWDRDPKLLYGEGELRLAQLIQGQLLHLDGNDTAASVKAAKAAKEAGMLVVLDIDKAQPGADELLSVVDFAIPNVDFVRIFSNSSDWREGLHTVAQVCPGFVAVTLGEQGAAALWERQIYEYPAFPVKAVDATGAGDIFHGAFVLALLQGWSLGRCMRFSNAAGALACTKLGARNGIPKLEEVVQLEETGRPRDVSFKTE
jgi:sugar/nucleoside kinase (ribokinase family)